jgi:leucyl-tRNA synthetase
LEKVYKLNFKVDSLTSEQELKDQIKDKNLVHKTIKKVSEDIENLKFNTAISALMILVNDFEKQERIIDTDYKLLLVLLAPFAPHLSEELWEKLGHKKSIFEESWPKYNEELIKDEEINLVIQINGKLRDILKVSVKIDEKQAIKMARKSQKIMKFLEGKEVKKTIFIPGKLINFVI